MSETALAKITRELFPVDLDEKGITFPNPLEVREKIELMQSLMCAPAAAGVRSQIKTTHRFAKGLYMREVFIPKGTLLIGKIHKHECLAIMSMGDKTVLTEDGVRRVKAPYSGVSRSGLKRMGFAHEDSIWITVHATNERDLEKIEEEFVAKSYEDVVTSESDVQELFTMEGA